MTIKIEITITKDDSPIATRPFMWAWSVEIETQRWSGFGFGFTAIESCFLANCAVAYRLKLLERKANESL